MTSLIITVEGGGHYIVPQLQKGYLQQFDSLSSSTALDSVHISLLKILNTQIVTTTKKNYA